MQHRTEAFELHTPLERASSRISSAISNARSFLQEEEDPFIDAICPRMSYTHRITGWASCFALGTLITALSFGNFTRALLGHPGKFASTYTMGNVIALCGSFFLSGPSKQLKMMKKSDRAPASVAFLITMVLTLWLAWSEPFTGRAMLIMLFVVVQWLALVWYSVSFIPYGRKMMRKFMASVCWCCCRRSS
eukprot:gnl/MRDRNA2_/MRDRNA2_76235_c0_seq1.p1 gnl/MRDRNA2_/MRDRNA2_76235_c0~~gnl/MRDRNA2_/MRDRNA2_76235_c0_seq1.p1  ORF type:complete len:191 (-),score=13.62 gnl/MRDRNA2_/MRDRNA2_76235_c0_seq1:34-606(-)